jgi:hypothetical protein
MEIAVFAISSAVVGLAIRKGGSIRNMRRRRLGDLRTCDNGAGSCDIQETINDHPDKVGVIAISLFGDMNEPVKRERYFDPVIRNAKIIGNYMPEWYIRVYLCPNVPTNIREELINADCEVCIMKTPSNGFNASMWRFLAAADDVPFLSMDADFKIDDKYFGFYSPAEHVKKWLQTDKDFFHRSLQHISMLIPISAGMWGGKANSVPDMKDRIEHYCADWFGCDEAFLSKEIYPMFKERGVYRAGNWLEIIVVLAIIALGFTILNFIIYRVVKRFE